MYICNNSYNYAVSIHTWSCVCIYKIKYKVNALIIIEHQYFEMWPVVWNRVSIYTTTNWQKKTNYNDINVKTFHIKWPCISVLFLFFSSKVDIVCKGKCPCPKPCICTSDHAPVCGKDHRTYSNKCQAACQ